MLRLLGEGGDGETVFCSGEEYGAMYPWMLEGLVRCLIEDGDAVPAARTELELGLVGYIKVSRRCLFCEISGCSLG